MLPPADPGSDGCKVTGSRALIFAAVNAAPYLSASFFGCWLSGQCLAHHLWSWDIGGLHSHIVADPLSERLLGRRAPIALSAVSVIASAIGSAFVQKSWISLLMCRIVLGLGMGTKVRSSNAREEHRSETEADSWLLYYSGRHRASFRSGNCSGASERCLGDELVSVSLERSYCHRDGMSLPLLQAAVRCFRVSSNGKDRFNQTYNLKS